VDIGKRIIELREDKGWSQYRLHKEAGIQQPTLRRYELGENIPGTEMLQKIATALGVSMAEFDDKKTAGQLAVEELIAHRPPAQTEEEARYYALFDSLPWEEKEKRLLRFVRSATVKDGQLSYELLAEEELRDVLDKLSQLSPESRKRLSAFLDTVIPRK
jgi:transcriptional regulator with XRE-family HTH domain